MFIDINNFKKFANPLMTLIGVGFAIFVVISILDDHMDPINESLRNLRNGSDEAERANILSQFGMGLNQRIPDKVIRTSITLLKTEPSRLVRHEAAALLGRVDRGHPMAEEAGRALAEALSDEDEHIRSSAAFGLLRLAPPAKIAAPALIEAVKSLRFARVEPASESATSTKPGQPREYNPDLYWKRERFYAIEALGAVGMSDPRSFETLKGLVRDSGPEIRFAALSAMAKYGSGHPREWEFLATLRHDSDPKIRAAVVDAAIELTAPLWNYRSHKSTPATARKTALSWFLDALDGDELLNLNSSTLERVVALEPVPEVITPRLIRAVKRVRQVAQSTEASARDFEYLVPRYDARSANLRALVRVLGQLGLQTSEVLDTILEQTDDPDWGVQEAVAEALVTHGQDDSRTVTALSRLLGKHPRDENVMKALMPLQNHAYLAFPTFRELLRDDVGSVGSFDAQKRLKELIKPSRHPKGFPPIEELWKGDRIDRLAAVMASDPNTSQGLALIIEALKDEDRKVRGEAIVCLEPCDQTHTPEALRALAGVASDPSTDLRRWAQIVEGRLKSRQQGASPSAVTGPTGSPPRPRRP